MANTDVKVTIRLEDQVSKKMPSITGSIIKANLALEAMKTVGLAAGKQLLSVAEAGIKYARLKTTLSSVASTMGVTEDAIHDMNTELANANLFGAQATETLLTFLQSGLSGSVDMEKFILMSKDFAASIGVSSMQGVKDFTKALGTLRPELLDKYRLTFNLNNVYKDYAKSIGKTVVKMSSQEKRLALLNFLYKQHEETVKGVYKKTYDTAGKSISSIKDATAALKDELGLYLEPAIQKVVVALRDLIQGGLSWLQAHEKDIQAFFTIMRDSALEVWDVIKNNLMPIFEVMRKMFDDIVERLAGMGIGWEEIAKGIGIAIAVIVGALVLVVAAIALWYLAMATAVTKVIEFVQVVIDGFNRMKATIEGWVASIQATYDAIIASIEDFKARIRGVLDMSAEDWAWYFGYMTGELKKKTEEMWADFGVWSLQMVLTLISMYEKMNAGAAQFWVNYLKTTKENGKKHRAEWTKHFQLMILIAGYSLESLVELIKGMLEYGLVRLFKDATEKVKRVWERMWNSLLFKAVSTIVNIIKAIDGLIKKLGTLKEKFDEGMSFSMKERAVGGFVQPSDGAVLVGERGAELFVPPTAGTIVPADRLGAMGSGGGGVNLTVNVGMYGGSALEKRTIAESLYEALVDYSTARNQTVAEAFGG